jgi:hypothetical protein
MKESAQGKGITDAKKEPGKEPREDADSIDPLGS